MSHHQTLRHGVRRLLLLIASLLLAPTPAIWGQNRGDDTKQSPNIVLLLLDDLDLVVTGAFYQDLMPVLAQVEQDGVVFTQAFSPSSICCAARASLLTGRYAHNTGVLTNGGPYGGYEVFRDKGNESHTIATYLHGQGYRTGAIGKYLNHYALSPTGDLPAIPPGWSTWQVFVDRNLQLYRGYDYTLIDWQEGQGPARTISHGSAAADYSTDVLAQLALDFIKPRSGDTRPFFLYLSPTAPHFPLPPAPRHRDKSLVWRDRLPKDRPNYFADGDDDFDDKPQWLRNSIGLRSQHVAKVWNNLDWLNRMGSLYAVNDMIASILAQLKASQQWDNTLLIITSDNGYNHGAHGLLHKMAPYEESIRIPLWIAGGKNLGLAPQARRDDIALLIDLAPTLHDFVTPLPANQDLYDGFSLRPLVEAKPSAPLPHRDSFLVEYVGDEAGHGIKTELSPDLSAVLTMDIPSYRGVRGRFYDQQKKAEEDYLYVEWLPPGEDFYSAQVEPMDRELYLLKDDPFQLHNLYSVQSTLPAELVRNLQERLHQLRFCQTRTCRSLPSLREGGQ